MFKNFSFLLLILISTSVSCSNTENEEIISEESTVLQNEVAEDFEKLPDSLVLKLYNECNSIDGTFYNSDKSISLNGENVRYILTMIKNDKPFYLNNNILGHLMLLTDGEEIAFVELSMKDGNNYLIYTINDKKYYNALGETGTKFFTKLVGNMGKE